MRGGALAAARDEGRASVWKTIGKKKKRKRGKRRKGTRARTIKKGGGRGDPPIKKGRGPSKTSAPQHGHRKGSGRRKSQTENMKKDQGLNKERGDPPHEKYRYASRRGWEPFQTKKKKKNQGKASLTF